MVKGIGTNLEFGMTLGIKEILTSKMIILLITGSGKNEATNKFLEGKINKQWPATYLWLHKNVVCLIDKN